MVHSLVSYICQSCRQSIQAARTSNLRHFSSTRQNLKSGGLPVFRESSSPELADLLSTIRSKRILPTLLNKQQRKLIQSPKKKAQLENEPVYATIGDEEVRLEYFHVINETPPINSYLKVVELTKTPDDWRNIPLLLEALHQSKSKVRSAWLAKTIKEANNAGMFSLILQCLQQVETNGFSLRDDSVRTRVLNSIRQNARNSDWSEEQTAKSLKQVQQVIALMEHPGHCGGRVVRPGDPRTALDVIGLPLELAATRAKYHLGGVDEGGLVAMYTTRLLAALEQQIPESSYQNILAYNDSQDDITNVSKSARLIESYLPPRNGLKLANEVLGDLLPVKTRQTVDSTVSDMDQKFKTVIETVRRLTDENWPLNRLRGLRYMPAVQEAAEIVGIPFSIPEQEESKVEG